MLSIGFQILPYILLFDYNPYTTHLLIAVPINLIDIIMSISTTHQKQWMIYMIEWNKFCDTLTLVYEDVFISIYFIFKPLISLKIIFAGGNFDVLKMRNWDNLWVGYFFDRKLRMKVKYTIKTNNDQVNQQLITLQIGFIYATKHEEDDPPFRSINSLIIIIIISIITSS